MCECGACVRHALVCVRAHAWWEVFRPVCVCEYVHDYSNMHIGSDVVYSSADGVSMRYLCLMVGGCRHVCCMQQQTKTSHYRHLLAFGKLFTHPPQFRLRWVYNWHLTTISSTTFSGGYIRTMYVIAVQLCGIQEWPVIHE